LDAFAILFGIMTLTIQYTMASANTWNGVNYANAFNALMTIAGMGILLGVGALAGVEKAWVAGKQVEGRSEALCDVR